MLKRRIIPTLLLKNKRLVKGKNFMNKKITLRSLEDTKNLGQEIAKEILKRKDKSAFCGVYTFKTLFLFLMADM